jgi:hypothetical protein
MIFEGYALILVGLKNNNVTIKVAIQLLPDWLGVGTSLCVSPSA